MLRRPVEPAKSQSGHARPDPWMSVRDPIADFPGAETKNLFEFIEHGLDVDHLVEKKRRKIGFDGAIDNALS